MYDVNKLKSNYTCILQNCSQLSNTSRTLDDSGGRMQEARTETEVVGNREGPADVRLLEMLRQHPHDET